MAAAALKFNKALIFSFGKLYKLVTPIELTMEVEAKDFFIWQKGAERKMALKDGCPLRKALDEINQRCYDPLTINPYMKQFKPIFGCQFIKISPLLDMPLGKLLATVEVSGVFDNGTNLYLQIEVVDMVEYKQLELDSDPSAQSPESPLPMTIACEEITPETAEVLKAEKKETRQRKSLTLRESYAPRFSNL
jgi:hypothetical protein